MTPPPSPPNAKRPVVVYTLASAGMGHATRALPTVERLSARFEVHVFCGGPAHDWLASKLPRVHRIRRFEPAFVGGRVSLLLVLANAIATLPRSLASMASIARVLITERPVALVTDFEALGAWTALLARPLVRTRIVAFDNFSAMRLAAPPFALDDDERRQLARWRATVRWVVPFADTFLVQSAVELDLHSPRARRVPPPIRREVAAYARDSRGDGPIVVSLGARRFPELPEMLRTTGRSFVIYGWPGLQGEERVGDVTLRPFHERAYFESLAAAPFAIVSANSSALDALALGAPVLVNPIPGQFEQRYSARLLETLGVARLVETLSAEAIDAFAADADAYRARITAAAIFDDERTFTELERAIEARG